MTDDEMATPQTIAAAVDAAEKRLGKPLPCGMLLLSVLASPPGTPWESPLPRLLFGDRAVSEVENE